MVSHGSTFSQDSNPIYANIVLCNIYVMYVIYIIYVIYVGYKPFAMWQRATQVVFIEK